MLKHIFVVSLVNIGVRITLGNPTEPSESPVTVTSGNNCEETIKDEDYPETTYHKKLADCLLASGKVDEAVGEYKKVLQIDPKDKMCRTKATNLLYEAGNWNDAIETSVHDPEVIEDLCETITGDKKWEEAIYCYSKAIMHYPNNIENLQNRAKCYRNIQNFDMARYDDRMVLRMKSTHSK